MASAVRVEDFFPRQRDLHRPARQLRELADDDLMRERIRLAAEAAADRSRDDPDVRRRRVEHLREDPMHVVRCLRRGPEGQLAVGRPVGDGGVLLHRHVSVALEEEHVLAHQMGAVERRVDVAELEGDVLVDVRAVAVVVDADLGMRERVEDRHERRQRLVVDLDQPARLLGSLLVHRRNRGDRIANHADLLRAEGLFILRHRQDAELHPGQVLGRDDREDARQSAGPRGVDGLDAGMGLGASEELGVRHARQEEIVGVFRLPDDLRPRIDFRERPADDRELVLGHVRASWRPIRRAASSTASRIFV